MTAWQCTACTAVYSVGAGCCPQCGAAEHIEEGQTMPKITRHGGASNKADDETEGGEQPSAGTSSSTSSAKDEHSPKTSGRAARSRARTTESHSPKGRTGASTASGTDGGQTARMSGGDA